MELEKNIYGLSEGVFQACQFLGLKFPAKLPNDFDHSKQHMPSDYFGDNFELNPKMKKMLRSDQEWSERKFEKEYGLFSKKFMFQKCFSKHTRTDLNIYFCDSVLSISNQNDNPSNDYFDFEFYNKSLEQRNAFLLSKVSRRRALLNEFYYITLLNNKAETNKLFANFIHRDWLNTTTCTFEEFKIFVEKHPHFFSKLIDSYQGKGAQIIQLEPEQNLKLLFTKLKKDRRILEEVVTQHKELSSFCPDTVNTIRVNTIIDIHNALHILTASGRFGRTGEVIDNYTRGGYAVIIDPQTGIIVSDGINKAHERISNHPDTGKTFKGFQYPFWEKIIATVKKMAKMIPQLHNVGWDITISDKDEIVLIEANGSPGVGLQQAADCVGRRHLYQRFLDEWENYKWEQMKLLGWRVNKLHDFDSSYDIPSRKDSRLKLAMNNLIPDCSSLMDLGCRNSKFVKTICPKSVKYFPVDFQKHFDEVIACDFNEGDFPDIKADAILCAFTAEYVEPLPQFLASMCNAAQKQILMLCRPITEKELSSRYRWEHPFLTDFTEEFLIKTMAQNNFKVNKKYPMPEISSIILYDFRRI